MDRIDKRLKMLQALKRQRINELLKDYHLSYDSYQIIVALHYAQGLTIEEIQSETKIDDRLIQLIINQLEIRGYIEVKDHQIYLTESIQKIYPHVKRLVKDSNDQLVKNLTLDEFHEIIENLDKLIDCYQE